MQTAGPVHVSDAHAEQRGHGVDDDLHILLQRVLRGVGRRRVLHCLHGAGLGTFVYHVCCFFFLLFRPTSYETKSPPNLSIECYMLREKRRKTSEEKEQKLKR